MPWKFIVFIAICILFSLFIVFNLGEDYTTNVSFIFATLTRIPVFLVVLFSFIAGACAGLLASIFTKSKKLKKEKIKKKAKKEIPEESREEENRIEEKPKEKRRHGRKNK